MDLTKAKGCEDVDRIQPLKIQPDIGLCEHDNKPSGSTKGENFLTS
jgi:hypothetical protein